VRKNSQKNSSMRKSDQNIGYFAALSIIIHLAILAIGITTRQLPLYAALLNLITGASIVIYWVQQQIRIKQHYFEYREMIVLSLEVLLIGCTTFSMLHNGWYHKFRYIQYAFLGLHLFALAFFAIFMLTFKMRRLI
jgi:hypothetical protein